MDAFTPNKAKTGTFLYDLAECGETCLSCQFSLNWTTQTYSMITAVSCRMMVNTIPILTLS